MERAYSSHRCRLRRPSSTRPPRRSRPYAACSASTRSRSASTSASRVDRELAELPGDYVSPGGCLLVARNGDEIVACAAGARSRDVRDEAALRAALRRGLGLGRALADAVIDEARRIGYRRMRLDTLPRHRGGCALRAPGLPRSSPTPRTQCPALASFSWRSIAHRLLRCLGDVGAEGLDDLGPFHHARDLGRAAAVDHVRVVEDVLERSARSCSRMM